MESLQAETLKLHEVAGRYIVEKNKLKRKIKTLDKDVEDRDQNYKELEDTNRQFFKANNEKS